MTLILASGSASRRAMLTAAGVIHDISPADVDERAIKNMMLDQGAPPAAIALALAEAKAVAVSRTCGSALVLGGDSLITVDGHIYDKPVSRANATDHLRAFSGKTMTLISAAVLAQSGGVLDSEIDSATLHMRPLSDGFIDEYLTHEWPDIAGCVGCFKMEGRGVHLFDAVTGSHFTILGMPLLWVLSALRRHGGMG